MIELIKDIMFWVIVITLFNIILRIIFNKSYMMHKPFLMKGREEGYSQGYNDASMNILLYYQIQREVPSREWLRVTQGKRLNTREKILESIV